MHTCHVIMNVNPRCRNKLKVTHKNHNGSRINKQDSVVTKSQNGFFKKGVKTINMIIFSLLILKEVEM